MPQGRSAVRPINGLYPFSAVTGKVEVKFCFAADCTISMFTKAMCNPQDGVVYCSEFAGVLLHSSNRHNPIIASTTHKIKDLSSFPSPSIGVRIWSVCSGDRHTYKFICFLHLISVA